MVPTLCILGLRLVAVTADRMELVGPTRFPLSPAPPYLLTYLLREKSRKTKAWKLLCAEPHREILPIRTLGITDHTYPSLCCPEPSRRREVPSLRHMTQSAAVWMMGRGPSPLLLVTLILLPRTFLPETYLIWSIVGSLFPLPLLCK